MSASPGKYSWKVDATAANYALNKIIVYDASDFNVSDKSDNYFTIITSTSTTNTTLPNAISGCDSATAASYSSAYDFGTTGGGKTNLCGNIQYFKITVPQNQICDLRWILSPDANSDYDLYARWDGGILDRYNYQNRSFYGRGQIDDIYKARVYGGAIYYAMAYKEANTSGVYSMAATLTNCYTTPTPTTTTIPTSTPTSSTATPTTTPQTTVDNSYQISQLQNQISQLLAQINQLKSQLQTVQPGQNTSINTANNANNNIEEGWCYSFTKNLKYGDSGNDVKSLQTVLQKEGVYSGKIGGNFGALTQNAVTKFQNKYLVSSGLVRGTGFVGAQTLNKINELYSCE